MPQFCFRSAAQTLRVTILALSVMCAGTTTTLAAGLFRPATPSEVEALAPQMPAADPKATRTGLLVIDTNYLRARVAPSNLGGLPEEERTAAAMRLPVDVHVELFFDAIFDFKRIDAAASGAREASFLWYGESMEPHNCDVDLYIMSDILNRADVHCGGTNVFNYRMQHLSGLYYSVEQVPVGAYPEIDDESEPTLTDDQIRPQYPFGGLSELR